MRDVVVLKDEAGVHGRNRGLDGRPHHGIAFRAIDDVDEVPGRIIDTDGDFAAVVAFHDDGHGWSSSEDESGMLGFADELVGVVGDLLAGPGGAFREAVGA